MDEFDLKTYMRSLVSEQTQIVLNRKETVSCNWCQKPIGAKYKKAEVDHVSPLFHELCCKFIEQWGVARGDVQSFKFRREWREYHRREARMQLLHAKCHEKKREGER
jgi:hypothetical protein